LNILKHAESIRIQTEMIMSVWCF